MASNTHKCLAVICLSACVMLSAGIRVTYVKYCGPPDKTFKYKISPWPVLEPGQTINATVTFTPAFDIFSSTLLFEVTSKNDGQVITKGSKEIPCDEIPQICSLPKGVTHTISYMSPRLRAFPPGFKGIFKATIELVNENLDVWFRIKAEVEINQD